MTGSTSPRSPSPGTTVYYDSEDEDYQRQYHRQCQDEEMGFYNQLISDGGRPSHPISLDYDIARNSEEYREILSFWHHPHDGGKHAWMVFSRQLYWWKLFRDHQRYVRESDRFSAYCQRLHDRLKKHGFERSFKLNEDPYQQNKLETWVEFLNYEYWQYDRSAGVISRRQSQHDEAWKKLVDSKILEPFETEELLWDFAYAMQLQAEENQAQEAVNSAISTVNLADQAFRKAQCGSFSRQSFAQIEQKLSIARSKLATATKSLEKISIRRKLISEFKIQTKSYSIAQDNASEQSILLRWILQQFPLIELELNSAEVTKNGSTQRNCKLQRSLKRNCTDDHNEESASKRRRQGGEDFMLSKSKSRASIISETSSTQQPKRSSRSYINPNILASDSYPQRAFRALRSSNTKSDSARSAVILDDNKQVTKNRRLKNKGSDGAPNSRVLRQSTRLKRPPDRFQ